MDKCPNCKSNKKDNLDVCECGYSFIAKEVDKKDNNNKKLVLPIIIINIIFFILAPFGLVGAFISASLGISASYSALAGIVSILFGAFTFFTYISVALSLILCCFKNSRRMALVVSLIPLFIVVLAIAILIVGLIISSI